MNRENHGHKEREIEREKEGESIRLAADIGSQSVHLL
jgi:hypothetical protein